MWNELLELAHPVERRRLVDIFGDRLQAGEDDDGVVARPAPGDGENRSSAMAAWSIRRTRIPEAGCRSG